MMKLIPIVLVTILVISLLGACCEKPMAIDCEPVDVRYTEAFSQIETDYVYKFNVLKGEFQLVPNTHTVHHPEKWEILLVIFYSDNTESHKWRKCTEAEYLAVKNYLDSGSCNGFPDLGRGDSIG